MKPTLSGSLSRLSAPWAGALATLTMPLAFAQPAAPSVWGVPAGSGISAPSTPSAQAPRSTQMTPPRTATGSAARPGASLKAAKPDLGALSTAPVRVIRVPSARLNPPTGAALQAANQQVLADARAVPLRDGDTGIGQPKRKAPVSSAQNALPMGAGYGQACIPGNVGAPKGAFTPGGMISIRGCELGSKRGELRMLGRFANGAVQLAIVEWTPQLVVASVPEDLRGVEDQVVRIQLIPRDGKPTKEQSAQFLARRETVELPLTLVANTSCARPQPSDCYISNGGAMPGAVGSHGGTDRQSGLDQWRLTMGPAWQLERIEHRSSSGHSEATAGPRNGEQQFVSVDWTSAFVVGPDIHSALYGLRFYVVGPVGVPFTGGVN